MPCDVSKERLWSWIDRDAPELEPHLAACSHCRSLAEEYRASIKTVAEAGAGEIPLPQKIGPYTVTGLLGEGGQALVYRAEQQTPHRLVAVKVLKGGRCVGQRDVRHFERESQTLAALSHPAIATIYEGGRTPEGQHYFAMELIEGAPLDVYVREHEQSLRQRLELFLRICAGVQYAHERGVIHRDLKPTNTLVTPDGSPRILDFGLARITNTDVTLAHTATETGQIVGTLRYMSPEQTRGQPAEIDARSDVYALGVILYELLTGQPPYELSDFIPEAVRTICETPPRRPSTVLGWDGRPARHLRGELETILLKTLEKEPSRRYASAGELSEDLRRYLAGEPIIARRASAVYVLRKKLTKHRLKVAVGAGVLLLGLAAAWGTASWSRHAAERQRAREVAEARAAEQREGERRHEAELAHVRRTALGIQRSAERGDPAARGRAESISGCSEVPEVILAYAQAMLR